MLLCLAAPYSPPDPLAMAHATIDRLLQEVEWQRSEVTRLKVTMEAERTAKGGTPCMRLCKRRVTGNGAA